MLSFAKWSMVNQLDSELDTAPAVPTEDKAPIMAKQREPDYFVPILAPYAQWVSAYRELISSLYEEHKTVKRTWKAFRERIPGVEQRLEFGVFEQILLFSLFLSEWHESGDKIPRAGNISAANSSGGGYAKTDCSPCSDTVIQELQNVAAERDKALWNLKHLEENACILRAEKEDLENRSKSFEMQVDRQRDELAAANEKLALVIRELDTRKEENAGLRLQVSVLLGKQAFLEDRIQKLKKATGPSCSTLSGSQSSGLGAPGDKPELLQTVIQWAGQPAVQAVKPESAQNPAAPDRPKKIGRWNAQLSKDGYYRLYRKIQGRVHSIYIGKQLDVDKARRRISEKEKKLTATDPSAQP